MKDDSRPICCEQPMKRLISAPGYIFKGGGWASQDIKRESEDGYIKSAARRARELKESGEVRMEDPLTFRDVERLNPE